MTKPTLPKALARRSIAKVRDDLCPTCCGDLDAGWECCFCGIDWYRSAFAGFDMRTKLVVIWHAFMFRRGFRPRARLGLRWRL